METTEKAIETPETKTVEETKEIPVAEGISLGNWSLLPPRLRCEDSPYDFDISVEVKTEEVAAAESKGVPKNPELAEKYAAAAKACAEKAAEKPAEEPKTESTENSSEHKLETSWSFWYALRLWAGRPSMLA